MSLASLIISFLLAAPFNTASKPVITANSIQLTAPDTATLTFDLNISEGWHVYSTALPSGGPISAEISFETIRGAEPVNGLQFIGNEQESDDQVFNMKVRFFEHKVRFIQKLHISSPDWLAEGFLTYGACNDAQCLPPQRCHRR